MIHFFIAEKKDLMHTNTKKLNAIQKQISELY